MDLLNLTQKICRENNIKPSRSRGQNFLVNEDIYDKIVATADLEEDDIVLEVGPGLGFLTAKLAKKVKRVIAVELDDKLAGILREGLAKQGIRNVEVVNEDILKVDTRKLSFGYPKLSFDWGKFKVVANLPYNITSIFLRKFLSTDVKPSSMTLMLQKEVAERICAGPPRMSLLAISVQFYAEPEIIAFVPADDFWPRPVVDSAIIKLKVKSEKLKVNEKDFFRLVRAGFSSRRKMLKNNLAAGWQIEPKMAGAKLKMAGFSEKIRAQELSVDDWLKLFEIFV